MRNSHWMERQSIDRIHHIHALLRLPMTFERILPRLTLLTRIEKLHRNSTLNTTTRIALPIRHASHCACHELQRALAPLERLTHVLEVVDVDRPRGHGDHELGADGGEGVDFVGLGEDTGLGVGGAGVEDFEGGIPGAGDEGFCWVLEGGLEKEDGVVLVSLL